MMLLPTMRGVGARVYRPPALVTVTGSTITSNGTASPIGNVSADTGFVYANRVITGKVYWETVILCGIPIYGIAQSTTGLGIYGGYSGNTLGAIALYSYTGTISRDGTSGVTPTDAELTRAPGKRIGISVDTIGKAITYYYNDVSQQSLSINTTKLNAGPLYPHVGAQTGFAMPGETCGDGSIRLQFCFGPSACTYAPPSGFEYY